MPPAAGVPAMSDLVSAGKGIAIWRQIEDALLGEISGGLYKPGDKLPTEAEMSARFGVNRHTVRRALASLAAAGKIRVEQGRGAFVHEDVVDYPVGPRTRFTENIHMAHRLPGRRILRAEIVGADAEVAAALKLPPGDDVVWVQSLNTVNDRPVAYSTTVLPGWRFSDAVPHFFDLQSITRTLALFGVPDYTRTYTRITAALPSGEVARHLQLPAGRPVLRTEGVDVDNAGRPVTYNVTQFASDRIQLVVDGAALNDQDARP